MGINDNCLNVPSRGQAVGPALGTGPAEKIRMHHTPTGSCPMHVGRFHTKSISLNELGTLIGSPNIPDGLGAIRTVDSSLRFGLKTVCK